MPIYEYRCRSCGHQFEDFRSAGEADDSGTCEKCGKPDLERLLSLFATGGTSKGDAGSSGGSCGHSGPHR